MRGKLLLLVEDNPDDEALTIRALKKNNIADKVIVARDGEEALNFLFGEGKYSGRDTMHQPQVILLDLKLPKVDGLEVLAEIRNNAKTRRIPTVVLTSSNEEQDIISSYDLGANSYVRKPVNFDDFLVATLQLGTYWLGLNEVIDAG